MQRPHGDIGAYTYVPGSHAARGVPHGQPTGHYNAWACGAHSIEAGPTWRRHYVLGEPHEFYRPTPVSRRECDRQAANRLIQLHRPEGVLIENKEETSALDIKWFRQNYPAVPAEEPALPQQPAPIGYIDAPGRRPMQHQPACLQRQVDEQERPYREYTERERMQQHQMQKQGALDRERQEEARGRVPEAWLGDRRVRCAEAPAMADAGGDTYAKSGGEEKSARQRYLSQYRSAKKKKQRREKASRLQELQDASDATLPRAIDAPAPDTGAAVALGDMSQKAPKMPAQQGRGVPCEEEAGSRAKEATCSAERRVTAPLPAVVEMPPPPPSSAPGQESMIEPGARKGRKLKSSREILRDEGQRLRTEARQVRADLLKKRRAAKLVRQGLTRSGAGHISARSKMAVNKRGRGVAKAKRAQRRLACDRKIVDGSKDNHANGGRQPLCKFWLTPTDRMLVLQSIALPAGTMQRVATCVNQKCGHAHTPEASEANRVRLIQTRKRKVAMVQRPQKKSQTGEERQGWLRKFDFNKGYGYISPVKLAKGRDPRKQELFFHITNWVGTPRLQASEHTLPLRVRYTSVPNDRDRGQTFRAAKVSASGPSKRPKTTPDKNPRRPNKTPKAATSAAEAMAAAVAAVGTSTRGPDKADKEEGQEGGGTAAATALEFLRHMPF